MADQISWIKNLLSRASPAEQAAVQRVGDYANRTGNETFILGSKTNPKVTTPLSTTGTPTNAGYPEGYNNLLLSLRPDELFTAHPHPSGASVAPSAADISVWSNMSHPDAHPLPTRRMIADADAARAGMWITSPKLGDNAQLYLPPFVSSGSADIDINKALQLIDRQKAAQNWNVDKSFRLYDLARDFNKAWGIPNLANDSDPLLRPRYTASLHYSQALNDLAKDVPVHVDPHAAIYPGSSFRTGEVWPEWMKYAEDKGYNPYSATGHAEGGQIPGYGEGGQKTAQAIRAALAAFDKTPKTEGYVYHATNVPRLHDIAEEGLRTHKPWEHTDQGAWPDGSVRKRAYFASSPEIASSFSPEEGPPALLRTLIRKGIERESTGDFYSHKPIKRDDLEWLDTSGAWNPLKLWGEE